MMTVLIADDDPVSLRLLERQLESAGYQVLKATNGREAFEIVSREAISMVVTDWAMPEMDGLELCRRLRASDAHHWIYTIVITAHRDDERTVEAFEAGADDLLAKPVDVRELRARLRAGERVVRLKRDLARKTEALMRSNEELRVLNQRLATANEQLERQAATDDLTALENRRSALDELDDLWTAGSDFGAPLACIVLDIDHFKSFNDTWGHHVGDLVLVEIARTLRASVRQSEMVYRFGGEEFLVLCPTATAAMALAAANRLRAAIEAMEILHGELALRVTASLGVAERAAEMQCPDDLLKAADEALYDAKRAGRNTVRVAPTESHKPGRRQDPGRATA